MLEDLTMIATLPVDEHAVQRAIDETEEVRAQQPEPPHPEPGLPKSPEQPVVPPDDPHRKDIDREPNHRCRRRRKSPASPSRHARGHDGAPQEHRSRTPQGC
jgi:hypothetical protein